MTRNLEKFSYPEKRSLLFNLKVVSWSLVARTIFERSLCPSWFKVTLLRIWGAQVGREVLLKRNIRISFPWRFKIGNHCWIGEEVWFINHEKVVIGNNVCISQRAIICSGGHDYRSLSLAYHHAPITISDGAWVCLDAKVLPGTRIGKGSVIATGEVARGDIPDFHLLIGGKLKAIEPPNRP